MYNPNQYAKDKLYRTQKIHEAEQQHLADRVQGNQSTFSMRKFYMGHRLLVTMLLVAVFVLFLLLVPRTINASDDKSDPGEGDAFYDQMVAFRLGYYYYVTGEYDRAVDYYNQAIEGIPEVVFTRMNVFRCIYWYRGDAQLKAGQPEAALESYHHYLELMGDEANTVTVDFVQTVEDSITSGAVMPEPL